MFVGTSIPKRKAEPSVECRGANKNLREGKANYIIYKLSDDGASIQVDVEGKDGIYEDLLRDLPSDECRWAVYSSIKFFFLTW